MKGWKANGFLSRRIKTGVPICLSLPPNISTALNFALLTRGQPLPQLAYVIDYRYPQEEQAQTRKTQQARQREWEKAQMKQSIAQAFNAAQAPRNWDYYMRVAKDSRDIAPDFAYDDGRFTYLGFSPIKTFPAALVAYGEKEHIVNASV